jgi:hypothetical protein
MTEELYVYEPTIISEENAAARAKELSIPQLVKGLPTWMVERGTITFGHDGTVVVVLSSVPRRNAAREVLAQLHDKDQTREALDAIEDYPADPVPVPALTLAELAVRVAALEALVRR